MRRRLHVLLLVALVVLLTITGWASASLQSFVAPARAQVVTPDPSSPSFANQQFVIVSDNITNPGEGNLPTFATGELPDPSAYPVTTVQIRNHHGDLDEQRFWLSVRIRQQDAGVDFIPELGYAQMGLIAPGGDATYTVTFPDTTSARLEFEVDGSTDEAVMLTLLQFALEAGFTAVELTGLDGHDAEIGRDLAEVVAEQYLADLLTLVPCANAVASIQRGLNDQPQFESDLQGCLESPIWQSSVDQVLARVAERDWFQQSLNLAGKAVPQIGAALKTVKAGQFAAQLWTMYDKFHPETPGAMVGAVAFLSMDTMPKEILGAATAAPDISIYEVVGRAQEAIDAAGTYRFQGFTVDADGRVLWRTGEVAIEQGARWQIADSDEVYYHVFATGALYAQLPDGSLVDRTPPTITPRETLVDFLVNTRGQDWSLSGEEVVDGKQAYVIERSYEYKTTVKFEALWIDSATFLPLKAVEKFGQDATSETEIVYSEFGAPVNVELPQESLASTPRPEGEPADSAPQTTTGPSDLPDRELSEGEIWLHAVEALNQAGTFRFREFDDRGLIATGSVDLSRQAASYSRTEQTAQYPLSKDEILSFVYFGNVLSVEGHDGSISQDGDWNDAYSFFTAVDEPNALTMTVRESENRTWYVFDVFYDSPSEVWIDSESFLPGKLVLTGPHGPREYVLSDFGAPVDIEAFAPTPTPAPANPLTSNDPTAIAEGFMQAVIAADFQTVQSYFAPDQQPDDWADIFGFGWMDGSATQCAGVDYQVVARQGTFAGIDIATITLVYESDCIEQASTIVREPWTNEAFVELESGTGTWYVRHLEFPN